MDKQARAQFWNDYLKTEGYAPQIDQDGDVIFKSEGKYYVVILDKDDSDFFRLVFPNFWAVENAAERVRVEKAALEASAKTKVAKVFMNRDDVWAAIEMFCATPEVAKAVFPRSMGALRSAVSTFVTEMRAK